MINYITLFTALCLSVVAAYYSIVGLTAIFSGAFWSILIMGSVLEGAKIASTAWLHTNWKISPRGIKYYLSFAVVVLMFITSMGIFGFLSKAHIETTATFGTSEEQIVLIDQQIEIERQKINDSKNVLSQLDNTVKSLIDSKRIRGSSGSISVRNSQKAEREQLTKDIEVSNSKISELNLQKTKYTIEQRKAEVEFGPLKYITELIYGESNKTLLEKSVRYIIIMIIFVFDPLALLLLVASMIGMSNKNTITEGENIKINKSNVLSL